jgi:hypothetical protein
LDVTDAGTLFHSSDDFENLVGGGTKVAGTGGAGLSSSAFFAPPGGHRRLDHGLHPVQSSDDAVKVFARRDVVVVHEELDHGVKTDRFSFSPRHDILLRSKVLKRVAGESTAIFPTQPSTNASIEEKHRKVKKSPRVEPMDRRGHSVIASASESIHQAMVADDENRKW